MHQFQDLVYTVDNGVATIRLDRPHVMNACSANLYREVRDAIRLADRDAAVDVVVVTGTGRAFSTGGDLKQFLGNIEDPDPLKVYEFADVVPFEAMRACSKVTIAAVNGTCVAGGLMIALSCDLVVASDRAEFGAPEGRVGMAEAWLPSLLFGRVSLSHMKWLILTGQLIGAQEAERIGLVNRVIAHDDLDGAVGGLVDDVRGTSPYARTLYKKFINQITPVAEASDSFHVLYSGDAQLGLENFVASTGGSPRFPTGVTAAQV